MDKKEKKMEKVQVPLELSSEVDQVYMTGAIGGYTPHDFRLIIFNEVTKEKNSEELRLVRNVSHEIIMSHRAVMELYNWLGDHIDDYNKKVEEIKNQKEE